MSRIFKDYRDLAALARENNFVATSAKSGKHNSGSKHYRGLAIDVRTRNKTTAECEAFMKICRGFGLTVRDERRKPIGQKVWNGEHLHIEI